MTTLRDQIIQTLLATRSLPEGVAADAILALMGDAEPVAHQFRNPSTGEWCNFMNDLHHRSTADAGYEIRALYTHPAPAVDDAVLRDAEAVRDLIMRDVCESDECDPADARTICINYERLYTIVERRLTGKDD